MPEAAITIDMLEAAEALLGIAYTAPERALMLDNLTPQIAAAKARRAVTLPATLAPATRFDPRLPGFVMPAAGDFVWAPAAAPLPARDEDIAFAPVSQLAGWIKSGALSAARLTEIYLARIAAIGPRLNCFAAVTAAAAGARAAELDAELAAGQWRGPLHGIPYGMKDIIDTAGITTGWGAEPYQNRVPERDAHVTVALREAGAIMLGKTTVGALAYGDLWYGGRTRNPWNVEEGSSGSSAGSGAATAAGLVGFAIGTETLGSIISPSTRCGTVGLRPSFGRVSRRGAMALCWSLDKIGPICRAVTDTALVLHALNTPDPADAGQIPAPFAYSAGQTLEGMRVGYFPADFEGADALDHAALDHVRALGLAATPLALPELPYEALMAILYAEAAAAFEELTLSNRDDELTWQDDDAWPNSFRKARFLSAVDHIQADRLRRLIMQNMAAIFEQVDVIIGPSLAGPMLLITNFTGHPSLCMPSGLIHVPTRPPVSLSRNEAETNPGPAVPVPHSISLWGKLFEEGKMLALAEALEAKLGFTSRPPV